MLRRIIQRLTRTWFQGEGAPLTTEQELQQRCDENKARMAQMLPLPLMNEKAIEAQKAYLEAMDRHDPKAPELPCNYHSEF